MLRVRFPIIELRSSKYRAPVYEPSEALGPRTHGAGLAGLPRHGLGFPLGPFD